jgi:hypothetical protein
MRYALCVIVLLFLLSACSNNGNLFIAESISLQDIVMNDSFVNLPVISLIDTGGRTKTASMNDFWFNANYVFVQDGKVKIKENAPSSFNDELEITYKNNPQIKTAVKVEKIYVQLISFLLSASSVGNNCPIGSSVQIIPAYTPKNASDKKITYEIIEGGDFSEITSGGVLSVREGAIIGTVITVRGRINEIINDLTVTVIPPVLSIYKNDAGMAFTKFLEVDYKGTDKDNGVEILIEMRGEHSNGYSYRFNEDIFINIGYTGVVTVRSPKYYAVAATSSIYYGDIAYIKDVKNKTVKFYVYMGQWAAAYYTPPVRLNASAAGTLTVLTGNYTDDFAGEAAIYCQRQWYEAIK